MNQASSKQTIRIAARKIRQGLSDQLRRLYAKQLASTLSNWPQAQSAKHISGYLAQDAELSLNDVFQHRWAQQKTFYLPVLRPMPPNRLWFAPYRPNTPLLMNKYNILEPDILPNQFVRVSQLELVLFPLVAFDHLKNRIGMGGGFYDRTFAHLRQARRRPKFVGIAYDEQQVGHIDSEDWDLPLDAIATPSRMYD